MDELLGGHLRVLREAAATGRPPGRAELDDCRAAGALAAERGASVRALVEAALAMAESVTPTPLPALRRTVSALMEGYENAQRSALRQEEAARREFVDDLLQGRADRLAERAEHFGLRLAETYVVAVARPAGAATTATTATTAVAAGAVAAAGAVEGAVEGAGAATAATAATAVAPGGGGELAGEAAGTARRIEDALVARFGSHNVLVAVRDGMLVCVAPGSLTVANGEFTHHVRQAFAPGWRVGLGRAHRGPGGVVTSYREGANAIELGDRLGLRAPVLKAADLLVFPVLLRDRAAIEDLVTSVLSPLLEARGGPEPLLATLEAVFASQGNQTAAARRLGVSTRAVTYRLERIRRLTGFSPDDATQRFTLETAVLGARLLDWPAHPLR
ncbi:PucR family transcriptional regulator [Streptosporangium sp. V21-05]|uniref:PucR family transcriptional regulator n=1 Tax=Streptosporangium sp. V21-05 TaxID=3446115 RepID=UPI003F53AA80